jgi:hypothetical protein
MGVKVGGSIPGADLGSTALTVVRGMGIKVEGSIPPTFTISWLVFADNLAHKSF